MNFEDALDRIREFHGHPAPGLIIGCKMVTLAMDRLSADILYDAVCETRSCLPDAVQMLTPCTIGNGWLRIADLDIYAVTLYDKFKGNGIRVAMDPERLKSWSEFHDWFFKHKTKAEQNFDLLIDQIHQAGARCLSVRSVHVKPQFLIRRSKGQIITCQICGDAYPAAHGLICRGCQGESPLENDLRAHLKNISRFIPR